MPATLKYISMPLVVFAAALSLRAQERLGIANSNYSPVNSIFVNPSSSADNRTYVQVNLLGLNAFATTNLAYLPQFRLWDFSLPDPQVDKSPDKKFLYANAALTGPAFTISRGNLGAGLYVCARSVVNCKRIPYQFAAVLLGENPVGLEAGIPAVRNAVASTMTWLEYGANFSWIIRKDKFNMMSLGTNLRYLTGINAAFAHLRELRGGFESTALRIDAFKGKVRFNDFAFNSGKGYAADIGFTYKKMLFNIDSYLAHAVRSKCRFIDYKYKLAFSLRDLGYIRFTRGTYTADYDASGYFFMNPADLATKPALNLQLNTPYKNDPFNAFMPASFSAQFDYNFENYFYLNATLVKNLVSSPVIGVRAPDLLSICPRFEIRNLEAALPITLQRFYQPQAGFALRIRTFVVGVDNLLPLIMARDTYSMGVYFNLGISLFKNPRCKSRKGHVDDCRGGFRKGSGMKGLFWKRMFKRNRTYSR